MLAAKTQPFSEYQTIILSSLFQEEIVEKLIFF
jgi:hypothetical protein